MPRSSRPKSTKHKDVRDNSDSEKELSLKERKSKEGSTVRVSKDSGSGDKRKLDSKDYYDNGEYYEEYTSSKRRKGKIDDSGSDKWNGKDEEKGVRLKKSKASSSEKSRRREEVDGEETKKSNGKSDSKHRESSRRESKEFGKEKDREKDKKYKEGKSEKIYDGEDRHKSKVGSDKTVQDHARSPGMENYTEKRSRRKRDDHGTGDKHQDNSNDVGDRIFASGDGYYKDGKQKGEKCGDKYWEDKEEYIKQKGDKQRDDRPTKEHSRSDDKLLRDENKKKSKFQDNDLSHEPDIELDGYHDREYSWDYERESNRNEQDVQRLRDPDRDYERDRDLDRDHEGYRSRGDYEHDSYHERDCDRGKRRNRDHDKDGTHDRKNRSCDYYHDGKRSKSDRGRDNDRDVSRLNDQSGRYKEKNEDRRSPDYQEVIMGSRSSRVEPDGDMIRSERQQSSLVVQEENGNVLDQITKGVSSWETTELSGGSERGTRQKFCEKTAKMEDGVLSEFPSERSSATIASPRPMVERSRSSTSLDRTYDNRSDTRRSLEVGETGHRNNARDVSAAKDKRLVVDETSQAELSFNNKANQNNFALPPRPESRSGISSPRMGPREEDNRVNTGGRYKRGADTKMGRGQGNVWRGVPSWPSPLLNGFIPFQQVPPHGGFQNMMPQFPSQSFFGVRPSMEMNHPEIPYHIPDAERFSGHMRPLGWQNMMDGSGASHMHGYFWDMSNGVFRDEPNMYGGSEWDHNRRMHGRDWESGADEWKTRNGDASMDVSSMSVKVDNSGQIADDDSLGGQTSYSENNIARSVEAGWNLTSPAKKLLTSSPKIVAEVAAEDPVTETTDNSERYLRHYLSKLDISVELTDPELRKSISLFMDEERVTVDYGAAVFVNLKEGGKRVPKGNSTSAESLSLIPSQNSSVFQVAMNLYKEQRVEMKGLPNRGPPQVSNNDDMKAAMKGNSSILKADVKTVDVSDSETPEKEVQTMETDTEDDGVPEAEPIVIPSLALVSMEVEEQKDICEDEKMEEEKKDGGLVVGDVSLKVMKSLVDESDNNESVVISRIHDSLQSTH